MTDPDAPANPVPREYDYQDREEGLTKREYFVGKIISGMVSGGWYRESEYPSAAIKMADALIEELNK